MTLRTNFFTLEGVGDFQISFTPDSVDVPTTSTIYLSRRNGFLASIDACKGTVANGVYGYLRDAIIQQSVSVGGYIEDRILSPYVNPHTGSSYLFKVSDRNPRFDPDLGGQLV